MRSGYEEPCLTLSNPPVHVLSSFKETRCGRLLDQPWKSLLGRPHVARNGQRRCFVEDAAALYLPPVFRVRNTKRLSERCAFLRVTGDETEENRARTGACTLVPGDEAARPPRPWVRDRPRCGASGCPWPSSSRLRPGFGAGVDPPPSGFERSESVLPRCILSGNSFARGGVGVGVEPWGCAGGGSLGCGVPVESGCSRAGSGGGGATPSRLGSCFSLPVS